MGVLKLPLYVRNLPRYSVISANKLAWMSWMNEFEMDMVLKEKTAHLGFPAVICLYSVAKKTTLTLNVIMETLSGFAWPMGI